MWDGRASLGLALAGFASLPVTMGTLFVGNIFLGVILPTAQVQALEEHGDIAGLASSLGGTMQMVAAGALVAVAGPFLDRTVTPMLGASAACGPVRLVLARPNPRPGRHAPTADRRCCSAVTAYASLIIFPVANVPTCLPGLMSLTVTWQTTGWRRERRRGATSSFIWRRCRLFLGR